MQKHIDSEKLNRWENLSQGEMRTRKLSQVKGAVSVSAHPGDSTSKLLLTHQAGRRHVFKPRVR